MKPNSSLIRGTSMKFPFHFRTVIFSKSRKRFLLQQPYGTSSTKPADTMSTKLGVLSLFKTTTASITPVIWRTVVAASSIFNSISFYVSKPPVPKDGKVTVSTDKTKKSTSVEVFDQGLKSTKNANPDLSELVPSNLLVEAVSGMFAKPGEHKDEDDPNESKKYVIKSNKVAVLKSSLDQRSRFLVKSLSEASSDGSKLLRLEELCKHLLLYPEQKTLIHQGGVLSTALRIKRRTYDSAVQAQARIALALLGFHDPPKGQGIRILSIDGGGTKGLVAIEALRQLEARTHKKVHELFDLMCGVSSGAILCALLGSLQMSLDECEALYRKLSDEIFKQSTFWGTGNLMWNHAYYDTTTWVNILKKNFGDKLLLDCLNEKSPKIALISAIMNLPHLQPFIFRNYDFSPRVPSHYLGSCKSRMWEAIRASGAAPGYFEEYCLDDYLHQDGGLLVNNPAALAIHEARLLWPSEPIQCVISLGSGRHTPTMQHFTSTSLKTKVLKIIDSATDTEAVHISLKDLLSHDTYFRINPTMTEFLALDETRPEKLDQMKREAQKFLNNNESQLANATKALCQPRSFGKVVKDWIEVKKALYF